MNSTFLFLDTETTGTGPEDRLVQLAYKAGDIQFNSLFKPPMEISIEAMSVCHITNEMVEDKPIFNCCTARDELVKLLSRQDTILVAHNAKFDIDMLKREDVKVPKHICTLKVARFLGRNDRATLQYLRYYYNVKLDGIVAHDAMGDVIVLEAVFKKLYEEMGKYLKEAENIEANSTNIMQKMLEISSVATCYKIMPFGKHKGLALEDVPRDYLLWLRSQPSLDEDMAYTIAQTLGH